LFGFNGQIQDQEWMGGQSVAFEFRTQDARLGRFLSTDPLAALRPNQSPYVLSANNPIWNVDYLGLIDSSGTGKDKSTGITTIDGGSAIQESRDIEVVVQAQKTTSVTSDNTDVAKSPINAGDIDKTQVSFYDGYERYNQAANRFGPHGEGNLSRFGNYVLYRYALGCDCNYEINSPYFDDNNNLKLPSNSPSPSVNPNPFLPPVDLDDDDDEYVSIWKAPQRGKSMILMLPGGFNNTNFPRSPYSDGKAYFAKERSLAQQYANHYLEGIIEIRVKKRVYDARLRKHEKLYQGGPLIEVPIPQEDFDVLNSSKKIYHPY